MQTMLLPELDPNFNCIGDDGIMQDFVGTDEFEKNHYFGFISI